MPLIQGGPPEWIWERTPNLLRWDVVPSPASNGNPLYELRVQCGLEIVRLQFLTEDEIQELRAVIAESANRPAGDQRAEPVRPDRQPEVSPERETGTTPEVPAAARPPQGGEGVVSDPDFTAKL